jgi:Rieske Fe-S protein
VIGVTGAAMLSGCVPSNNSGTATPQATVSTGSQGPVAAPGIKVGTLEDFKTVGAFKEVTVGSTPVVVSRVASGGTKFGDANLAALSRLCTHLGCLVGSPKDNAVDCGCHGSVFDATTGAVKQGPASQPLKSFKLEARSDGIYALTV